MFEDFFNEFFIRPIVEYQGYNLVNTLAFAAILLGVSFLVIFPVLDRKGVKFNARFMLSLLPYILFGITIRILEDVHIVERSINPLEFGFYTYTPGIWLLTAAVTIAALFASLLIAKKIRKDSYLVFAIIGAIIAAPIFIWNLLLFREWFWFFGIIALVAIIVSAVLLIFKFAKHRLFKDKLNILALCGQALDGTTTVIATQILNCGEQHPLSGALLNIYAPLFIIVKIILVIAILHYVDNYIKNENLRGFIKIVITILGFATGTRDLFTVGAGTCA